MMGFMDKFAQHFVKIFHVVLFVAMWLVIVLSFGLVFWVMFTTHVLLGIAMILITVYIICQFWIAFRQDIERRSRKSVN